LTEVERRPFFAMTSEPVDRRHKHQGRATRHPEWVRVASTIRGLVGTPLGLLTRPVRGQITHKKACGMILGMTIGAGASEGRYVENIDDFLSLTRSILERNDITDQWIANLWNKKATSAGMLPCVSSTRGFPPSR